MSTPKMTADEVKQALRARHGCNGASGQWVCIEEAFSGWQSAGGGVDLFAVGCWSSAKAPGLPGAGRRHGDRIGGDESDVEDARWPLVAYEVKVSRADYRREVNGYEPGPKAGVRTRPVLPWPGKACFALDRSHYFMFAVPKGLLTDDEIAQRERAEKGLWLPPEVGLVEVDGRGCKVRVPAPRRRPRPLSRPEIAELVRHAVDPNVLRQARLDALGRFDRYEVLEALGADALKALDVHRENRTVAA